jgi:hypothetical protein
MLLNPKYRGDWSWNLSRWQKKPEQLLTEEEKERARVTGHHPRMRLAKSEEEAVTRQDEDLRIVPEGLWGAVQSIFEARKGLRKPTGRSPRHLLSGQIKCTCGGSIVVLRSHKGNSRYTELGCPRHRNRGPLACGNGDMVREPDLAKEVLRLVKEDLLDPDAVDDALADFNRQLEERARSKVPTEKLARLRRELTKEEIRIDHYVQAIGEGLDLGEVREALQACTQRREALQAEIAKLQAPKKQAQTPRWTRQQLVGALDRLWELLTGGDVSKARWLLQKLLGPGTLEVLNGKEKRAWRITFQARPLDVLLPEIRCSYKGGSGGPMRMGADELGAPGEAQSAAGASGHGAG